MSSHHFVSSVTIYPATGSLTIISAALKELTPQLRRSKLLFMQINRTTKLLTNQHGVALLGILVAVTILGLLSGIAGSTWKTTVQRAKEQELLWRGNQYRSAIESYYTSVKAGVVATLPRDLESLVKDPRSLTVKRYLRKLYPDPMSGEDWVLVKGPGGGITGVKSSSSLEPFKKDGFAEENKEFVGKTIYSDWQFIYKPKSVTKKFLAAPAPAATNNQ